MGTDRTRIFDGPCPCGNGKIVIDHCTPDHGWPVANPVSYEARIACAACKKRLEIEQRGKAFVFVERAQLEAQAGTVATIGTELDGIMQEQKVQSALDQAKVVLDSQPSKAAIYRLLNANDLVHSTQATFTRKWLGAASWMLHEVRPANVTRYFKIAGIDLPEISSQLSELEKRLSDASAPLEPLETIYELGDHGL